MWACSSVFSDILNKRFILFLWGKAVQKKYNATDANVKNPDLKNFPYNLK